MSRFFPKLFLLFFLALAACESAEERAERFYQSGLSLLEEGDVDRALVQFRNVFANNPHHLDGRLIYAETQLGRGEIADAYGQYVQVVEFDPDNKEGLIALSEISILADGWEEAQTYGRRAATVAPDDDRVIIVNAMLDYRDAVISSGDPSAPAATAKSALDKSPDSIIARKIVIDHAIQSGDLTGALVVVEDGLNLHPDRLDFHAARVALLSEGDDTGRTQSALETMAAQFPENLDVQRELFGWYIQQDDLPAAERYLRELAAAPNAGEAEKIVVVDFLRQTKGVDAAQVELESLIASQEQNARYRSLRASILFAQGDQATAVAELEAIIDADVPAEQALDFKILLAQMLNAQGKTEDAKAQVANVLETNAGHVEALRMQAAWAIEADDPGSAVIILRQALTEAPRDVGLITMLAGAHERAGDHNLAAERYAVAVEVSNQAVNPSLRQANYLLQQNWVNAAETVINSALVVSPQNAELLAKLAEIHLRLGDWNKVTRTIWKLRAIDTPQAVGVADQIEVALLNRQERYDDTQAFLENIVAGGESTAAAKARLVEAQIRAGRLDEARAFVATELETAPDDPTLRFLQADILVLMDDAPAGEAIYRDLLASYPTNEQVLGRLYGLLLSQDRQADGDAVLDQVLADAPDAMMANLIKSGRLEALGDFDGAIAILEQLYARDSSSLIVANNLASLITTHRDDDANLERAYGIAARMRGTDVPAFQDTLGWIAYRRGEHEEALSYLEPAARGLPEDALTQFHLGLTYVALERNADAIDTLTRAVSLGQGSDLPQIAEARRILSELQE